MTDAQLGAVQGEALVSLGTPALPVGSVLAEVLIERNLRAGIGHVLGEVLIARPGERSGMVRWGTQLTP